MGYSLWNRKESDMTERLTLSLFRQEAEAGSLGTAFKAGVCSLVGLSL